MFSLEKRLIYKAPDTIDNNVHNEQTLTLVNQFYYDKRSTQAQLTPQEFSQECRESTANTTLLGQKGYHNFSYDTVYIYTDSTQSIFEEQQRRIENKYPNTEYIWTYDPTDHAAKCWIKCIDETSHIAKVMQEQRRILNTPPLG